MIFQGSGGRDAKPAYPLTPAALLGSAPTLEETKNKMEDVDRIRTNLRETRTVSSSLLKVLMPRVNGINKINILSSHSLATMVKNRCTCNVKYVE